MKINQLKIAFIGGIHGVGKSRFSEMVGHALNIPCVSASDLITRQRNALAAVNKRVQNVDKNQDALIAAIESSLSEASRFILDGHFCVFDTAGVVHKIPIHTFQKLSPVAAVVLLDDVNQIERRLRERDKNVFPIETLEALQRAESAHAENVCRHLNIPLRLIRPDDQDKAVQFIRSHLN